MSTQQTAPVRTEALAHSLTEAAQITSISTDTLSRAIERGDLKASRPTPGRVVILRDDLIAWIRGAVA